MPATIMARPLPRIPGDGFIDADGGHMKRAILIALGTGALISSAAAIGIGMASAGAPEALTRASYEEGLAETRAIHATAMRACEGLRTGERDTCRAEADAAAAIRGADLRVAFERTEAAARDAQRTRIDARYQIRRAHCQAQGGFRRDKCAISAHAERGRALLDVAAPYAARHGF
jgi:hypothetical protein